MKFQLRRNLGLVPKSLFCRAPLRELILAQALKLTYNANGLSDRYLDFFRASRYSSILSPSVIVGFYTHDFYLTFGNSMALEIAA